MAKMLKAIGNNKVLTFLAISSLGMIAYGLMAYVPPVAPWLVKLLGISAPALSAAMPFLLAVSAGLTLLSGIAFSYKKYTDGWNIASYDNGKVGHSRIQKAGFWEGRVFFPMFFALAGSIVYSLLLTNVLTASSLNLLFSPHAHIFTAAIVQAAMPWLLLASFLMTILTIHFASQYARLEGDLVSVEDKVKMPGDSGHRRLFACLPACCLRPNATSHDYSSHHQKTFINEEGKKEITLQGDQPGRYNISEDRFTQLRPKVFSELMNLSTTLSPKDQQTMIERTIEVAKENNGVFKISKTQSIDFAESYDELPEKEGDWIPV